MLRKIKSLLLASAALLALSSSVMAEDQSEPVVAGIGIGAHTYDKVDDLRKGSTTFDSSDEVRTSGAASAWLDVYFSAALGFGVRAHNSGITRSYIYAYGSTTYETEQTFKVDTTLGTLTLRIPLGTDGYWIFSVQGGMGTSKYGYEENYIVKTSTTTTTTSISSTSVTGTAAMAGAFLDWGGEDFGARLGYYQITTQFPKMKIGSTEYTVDGSGHSTMLDLRWAF